MMRLFFEPNDVWLFRDGRPFDVYAGHRAHTLFPPFPSVIQGAIRSAHLAFRGVSLDTYLTGKAPKTVIDEIGSPSESPPSSLKLRGPFVAKRQTDGTIERFFPRPVDAYLAEDKYVAFLPNAPANICSNLPEGLRLLFEPEEKSVGKVSNPDLWWRESALQEYLTTGRVKKSALRNENTDLGNSENPISIFKRENRVGIHLQSHIRRPREGFIYEIEYARLNDGFGLEVEIEGLPDTCWPISGMVRMGGDSRTASFVKNLDQRPSLPDVEVKGSNTKIYFATPTYFNNGWQPRDWSKFIEGEIKLVAAAVEKPLSVGGIDLAKSALKNKNEMHKPARRYVPAGSVYFFEGEVKLKKGVQAVTDYGENIGFGQIILGRW